MTTTSLDAQYTLRQFHRDFPNDEACLEHLWRIHCSEDGEHADCPKCEQTRRFKRYATAQERQSWTCTGCGHHVHPTAGTIFEKSSTPLTAWFFAAYLLLSTSGTISALRLANELAVTYKTARRIKACVASVVDTPAA